MPSDSIITSSSSITLHVTNLGNCINGVRLPNLISGSMWYSTALLLAMLDYGLRLNFLTSIRRSALSLTSNKEPSRLVVEFLRLLPLRIFAIVIGHTGPSPSFGTQRKF